jgi:hypothetical protein
MRRSPRNSCSITIEESFEYVSPGAHERDLDVRGTGGALGPLHRGAVERRVVGLPGARVVERQVAYQRDLEERLALARGILEPAQERACAPVVVERLVVGVDRARRVAGEQRVAGGPLGLVGLGEVARERPVDRLARIAVERLDRLADAPVQVAPGRLEQAVVSHLLDEAVAEPVLG